MDKYNELLKLVQEMEADFQKFYDKGQSAPGTRLRKGLNDLKKKAQELRLDVQNTKNSRKESK
ncbi:MAG: histone H1 [Ignavibacteriaceae bacterium]|nr:histone H1 [Ignavibacteriaceae bacterium]